MYKDYNYMTNKHCLVYETLGKVSNLTVMEGSGDGLMRLEGVFGVIHP